MEDPSKADTSKADPSKADPSKADPSCCEAAAYGFCEGKIIKYTYPFRYTCINQEYLTVSICDFHHKRMLDKNKGREPETYGWTVDDALHNLFHCCEFNDKYTFWYCTVHDDGVLIKDQNTDEVPEWYANCMCKDTPSTILNNPCEQIDWYKTGVINYDGKVVTELEPVEPPSYYDKINGGFKFKYYSYEYLIKDKKRYIIVDEYSPIKSWFRMKERL
jgi:hypothetical protein